MLKVWRTCIRKKKKKKKKEMLPLTDKEINSYEKQEVCHLCKEKFCTNKNEKKKIVAMPKSQRSLPLHMKF